MTNHNPFEKSTAFAQAFWTNDGKSAAQKPQNPIAAKQALYLKDDRTTKVSLAQGMVFNDRDRVRIYHSDTNQWFDSTEAAQKGGVDPDACETFVNKTGKIFHSPAVYVAEQRALQRFKEDQFGDDTSKNPAAYGTPTLPALVEAMTYDAEDIYGSGRYDRDNTLSFQTLGMASGYKHLTLPVLNSSRASVGLPPIENIVMGSNFYGAYPATFDAQTIHRYRYMDDNGSFDLASFKKAAAECDPKTTLFLFDMSTGNNFVGVKRTREDNENIADVLIERHLYSEHDIAYPNFDPSFDEGGEIYRILQRAGAPHGVQSSRGKKDKYASRLAFHHLYLGHGQARTAIMSHLVSENRSRFLALPKNWSYLVELARDPELAKAHKHDEQSFVEIVNASRRRLGEALGWQWMLGRSGMFDMVEITHAGIEMMGEKHAVYAVPARDQNRLGADGLPLEVTRIKHGIPATLLDNVVAALRDAAAAYPSETGTPNNAIITGG